MSQRLSSLRSLVSMNVPLSFDRLLFSSLATDHAPFGLLIDSTWLNFSHKTLLNFDLTMRNGKKSNIKSLRVLKVAEESLVAEVVGSPAHEVHFL